MILLTHVIIALAGLAFSTFSYLKPSNNLLLTSGTLGVLTLFSGIILVVSTQSSIVKSCAVGIAYFTVTIVLTYLSYKKLRFTA